jgi:hypothetical protein
MLTLYVALGGTKTASERIYVEPKRVVRLARGRSYTAGGTMTGMWYMYKPLAFMNQTSGRWGTPMNAPRGMRRRAPETVIEPTACFQRARFDRAGR